MSSTDKGTTLLERINQACLGKSYANGGLDEEHMVNIALNYTYIRQDDLPPSKELLNYICDSVPQIKEQLLRSGPTPDNSPSFNPRTPDGPPPPISSSPAYNPSSPVYSATSPVYVATSPHKSLHGSPTWVPMSPRIDEFGPPSSYYQQDTEHYKQAAIREERYGKKRQETEKSKREKAKLQAARNAQDKQSKEKILRKINSLRKHDASKSKSKSKSKSSISGHLGMVPRLAGLAYDLAGDIAAGVPKALRQTQNIDKYGSVILYTYYYPNNRGSFKPTHYSSSDRAKGPPPPLVRLIEGKRDNPDKGTVSGGANVIDILNEMHASDAIRFDVVPGKDRSKNVIVIVNEGVFADFQRGVEQQREHSSRARRPARTTKPTTPPGTPPGTPAYQPTTPPGTPPGSPAYQPTLTLAEENRLGITSPAYQPTSPPLQAKAKTPPTKVRPKLKVVAKLGRRSPPGSPPPFQAKAKTPVPKVAKPKSPVPAPTPTKAKVKNLTKNQKQILYKLQFGGAAVKSCGICRAPGTNSSTCPYNPRAVNPKPSHHAPQ
jgi:hypothetical protein